VISRVTPQIVGAPTTSKLSGRFGTMRVLVNVMVACISNLEDVCRRQVRVALLFVSMFAA
jgi:hypothetical protein